MMSPTKRLKIYLHHLAIYLLPKSPRPQQGDGHRRLLRRNLNFPSFSRLGMATNLQGSRLSSDRLRKLTVKATSKMPKISTVKL
jgi:hypothetical protein